MASDVEHCFICLLAIYVFHWRIFISFVYAQNRQNSKLLLHFIPHHSQPRPYILIALSTQVTTCILLTLPITLPVPEFPHPALLTISISSQQHRAVLPSSSKPEGLASHRRRLRSSAHIANVTTQLHSRTPVSAPTWLGSIALVRTLPHCSRPPWYSSGLTTGMSPQPCPAAQQTLYAPLYIPNSYYVCTAQLGASSVQSHQCLISRLADLPRNFSRHAHTKPPALKQHYTPVACTYNIKIQSYKPIFHVTTQGLTSCCPLSSPSSLHFHPNTHSGPLVPFLTCFPFLSPPYRPCFCSYLLELLKAQ